MSSWPKILEPELRRRLGMSDEDFREFILGVIAELAPRHFGREQFEQAVGYPWARPAGSFQLTGAGVERLDELGEREREEVLARFTGTAAGRTPLLSIGSNAAPVTLGRKFAHFSAEEDRAVLALTGHLHDFDVSVAAQPTMYGSMPATLFPSPRTAVAATVLWVTPAQFTQLAWSEVTYRLGRLRTRFEHELDGSALDQVLVFVSRFGAFCPTGEPVALAAIPAAGRAAPELSQKQLLDAAAALALGPDAGAETLVRTIFEEPQRAVERIAAGVHPAGLPFDSKLWTPFEPTA